MVPWAECQPEFPGKQPRRRQWRPNNCLDLARALGHHAQEPNIPFRNPSLRLCLLGWHLAQETTFGVLNRMFDSCERYLDFDTGALHIISNRMYLAEWFSLGSHIWKIACLGLISQIAIFICLEHSPKMVLSLNVTMSLFTKCAGGAWGELRTRIPYRY